MKKRVAIQCPLALLGCQPKPLVVQTALWGALNQSKAVLITLIMG